MKKVVFSLLLTSFTFSQISYAKQDNKSLRLTCTEFNYADSDAGSEEGSEEQVILGKVLVQFQANGKIQSIKVDRKNTNALTALKKEFNNQNSRIEHGMVKSEVDENGDLLNNFGIEAVENIVVAQNGAEVLRIRVNDHSYSGNPGSSIAYSQSGKVFDTNVEGNAVTCEGRVLAPWNTGLDDLE